MQQHSFAHDTRFGWVLKMERGEGGAEVAGAEAAGCSEQLQGVARLRVIV